MSRKSLHYARSAGILYFITHLSAVIAVPVYATAETASGIRTGVLLEFILALGCLGTGLFLLPLLQRFGEVRTLSFLMLRGLEASVILAGTLPMMTIASMGASASDHPELSGLHGAAFLLGQGLIISVNTVILGSLLLSSGLVPRALALLGMAGGLIVLLGNLAQLYEVIPQGGAIGAVSAIPIFIFEIWFAITLVIGKRFKNMNNTPWGIIEGDEIVSTDPSEEKV